MQYFRPGSQLRQLITMLSIVGEYPIRSLYLLGNERAYKALVHKLTTPETFRIPQTETEMTTQPYSATDIIPAQTTSSDSTETAQTTPQKTTAVGTTAPEPVKNTAPDFAVLDGNGNTVRLSDKFGKPVVINFWATWCPPCKQELPDFDKLCKEYGDRVVFMMVNLTDGYRDTVDGTKRFVSGKGYTFPVYFDTKDNAASAYNVSSIPQTTFIDANGNIYTTRIGAMNEATLRIYLNALLGN